MSSAERVRIEVISRPCLGQSKVCNLDVAVFSQQDIVWLQVSIDHTVLVQVLKCQDDLASVDLGYFFRQTSLSLEVLAQITARAVLKKEKDVLAVLEGEEKLHQKVAVCVVR